MESRLDRVAFDDPDLTLNELMNLWPETVEVFVRRQMICVGCVIGHFHTIKDACREYGLDEAELRAELWRVITVAASPH